jgi:hypothetical protein
MSICPHLSIAAFTMRAPPSIVATLSATAIASPPALVISATTSFAGSLDGSRPSPDTP